MRYLWLVGLSLVSFNAYAVCPAAPVGAAADPVLQLRLNADARSAYGPSNVLSSIEEGALVWDDTANAVAYCDGTNWVTLGAGGSDNLGNHTATQNIVLGGYDITGIDSASGNTFSASAAAGLMWEGGVNALTHNDGGGNVQMRLGHDYTSSDERFTHAGGAAVITSNIDATANTALTFKVSSNPGAGNDQPVVWGSSLVLTPTDVTFGGTSLLNGGNADTVDSLHAASFLRADADDSTTGNLGFTSGHGKGLRFWNSDSYKIYMSSTGDATWGGRLDTSSDYNMYFRMNGGTNRGFVFRNNTTNVAQIDAGGNMFINGTLDVNSSKITSLATPTAAADAANKSYVDSVAANADTVDTLHATSFIRADANDDVSGHTEWQDNMQLRLGAGADMRMYFNGTDTYMRSYAHGSRILLQGEDAGGTNRNQLVADPDASVRLYFNGAEKFRTETDGVTVYGKVKGLTDPTSAQEAATKAYVDTAAANSDTVDSLHAASFIRADANDNVSAHTEWQDGQNVRFGTDADYRMWHDGTNMYMRGYRHGAAVTLSGEDAAGTNRSMIYYDPDSNVRLYYNGTEKFRTNSDGIRAYKGLEAVAVAANSARGFSYVELNGTDELPMFRAQTENGADDDKVFFKVFSDANVENTSLTLDRITGAVNLGSGSLVLDKNDADGNVGVGPDIWMSSVGMIAAQSNLRMHIDSSNDGEGQFAIWKGTETNSGGTKLVTVANNGTFRVDVGPAEKPGGGSWSSTSDIRLKDIDGDYTKGLADIVQLEPIMFHYKKDNVRELASDRQEYGFVAQDVKDVFPEAVSERDDGYLDFNMHTINVAVVNALKELKAENDELKARLKALEDKLQ